MSDQRSITVRAFVVGIIFTAVFAWLTVYFGNVKRIIVSATQIPILPYILLFAMVLLLNPLCRLIRFVRPFSPGEILIVLVMGVVTAGVSTFGLSAQVVPIMGNLFNSHWNTDQSEWSRYVEPYVNDQLFVSEPGIRDAAERYAGAVAERNRDRKIHDTALRLTRAQERMQEAAAALKVIETSTLRGAEREMTQSRAQSALRPLRDAHENALADWNAVLAVHTAIQGESPQHVVTRYRGLLKQHEGRVQETREALSALKAPAFVRVEQFRRGLPPDLRAYPGIVFTADDSVDSYIGRLRRCVHGRRALKSLRVAYDDGTTSSDDFSRAIDSALQSLRDIDTGTELQAVQEALSGEDEHLRAEAVRLDETLAEQYEEQRFTDRDRRVSLDKKIGKNERRIRTLKKEQQKVARDLELVGRQLETVDRIDHITEQLSALRDQSEPPVALASLKPRLAQVMRQFPSIDASLRRLFLGDIPWNVWLAPLLRWSVLIVLTYAVLMAFNVLIFRQWAYNEKLTYPLAELSEELAGAGDTGERALPRTYRSALFWAGVAVPGVVLGWNLFVHTDVIPGLKQIELSNSWNSAISNSTVLAGLKHSASSTIFFTMIGLSFLISQKISFSLWFFSVLGLLQLLVMVWLGYGVDKRSFPADWMYTLNFHTSEGCGALLVFSSVVLYKCRKYILCCFAPSAVSDLEIPEQRELRVSSFLFVFGSIGIILFFSYGIGAHPAYAVLFYILMLLVSIGLIRAVTEGGILGFQAWAGPFHFIRSVVGMDRGWTSPALFSPLMLYYIIFFFDLKTFIAPAMANGIRIRDNLKMGRKQFHLAIAAALVVAVVVAVGVEIMMAYARGADHMLHWFHTSLPQITFSKMADLVRNPPAASPEQRGWIGVGAVTMAALLFFRQRWFWLPHPLGLIMLVNPLMRVYWFSIMLGWLAKSLVTKYGSQNAYTTARNFFIGLIAGELFIVALALIFSVALDANIPIDLNR